MCDRCDEIGTRIAHYRTIVDLAMDPLTRDRTAQLIAELAEEKIELHPHPKT
jgi:hypothetical protein